MKFSLKIPKTIIVMTGFLQRNKLNVSLARRHIQIKDFLTNRQRIQIVEIHNTPNFSLSCQEKEGYEVQRRIAYNNSPGVL